MASKHQNTYKKSKDSADREADKQSTCSEDLTPKGSAEFDMSYMGSREERADVRTVASRKRLQDKMRSDVDEFLAHGGEINQIDTHVTADPPKRPVSRYGHRAL